MCVCVFVLACLACSAHGRSFQSVRLKGSFSRKALHVQRCIAAQNSHLLVTWNAVKVLATQLLAFNSPAVRLQSSGHSSNLLVSNVVRSPAILRSVLLLLQQKSNLGNSTSSNPAADSEVDVPSSDPLLDEKQMGSAPAEQQTSVANPLTTETSKPQIVTKPRLLPNKETSKNIQKPWQNASMAGQGTTFVAETVLGTPQGDLRVRAYRHVSVSGHLTEPLAMVFGDIGGSIREEVAVRVHDACFTSEVLGCLKCDCAQQLEMALEYVRNNNGVVIYLQQEGRGIGLANKVAAYALQRQGFDTIEANRALGLPDDAREYDAAKNILENLGVKSIKLMTNNQRKVSELSQLGIRIVSSIPCVVGEGCQVD